MKPKATIEGDVGAFMAGWHHACREHKRVAPDHSEYRADMAKKIDDLWKCFATWPGQAMAKCMIGLTILYSRS